MNQDERKKMNTDTADDIIAEQPGTVQVLLLGLFVFVASVYLPFAVFEGESLVGGFAFGLLSFSAAVLGIAALVWLTRSWQFILSYVLILGALLLLSGSPVIPGILSAFVSSVLAYTFITEKKPSVLLLLVPALAYPTSYFICHGFLKAALCLFFIPPALFLALSVRRGLSRVGTICRVSAGIAVCFVATSLGWVFMRYGKISLDIIDGAIEDFRAVVISELSDSLVQVYSGIGSNLSINDATAASTTLVTGVFNVLPAIFVISCNIAAYLIQSLYVAVMMPHTKDHAVITRALTFDMSLTSAVVFIVSYFLKAVLSTESTLLYSATAENISLILEPGLALTALLTVRILMKKKGPSCSGVLLYFLFFMLFLYIPAPMLSIASFAGAIFIIVGKIKERSSRKVGR